MSSNWEALVHQWAGLFITVDEADRIVSVNRTTKSIDAERDVGRDLFELVLPDEHEGLRAAFGEARAERRPARPRRIRFQEEPRQWHDYQLVRLPDARIALVTTSAGSASDVQRSEQRLRILAETTGVFSEASRSPDQLFEAIARELGSALHCASALALIADDDVHFTIVQTYAPDPAVASACRAYMATSGHGRVDTHPAFAHVVRTGKPLFVPRLEQFVLGNAGPDTDHTGAELAGAVGFTSIIVVPLRVQGRLMAVLTLSRYGDAPHLDDEDLTLAQTLAEHASLALTAGRLLEEAKHAVAERERSAARVRLVAEAKRKLDDGEEPEQVLSLVARGLGEVIGDTCVVSAVSEDGAWLEGVHVYHEDGEIVAWVRRLLESGAPRVGEGLTGRVAALGEAILIPRTTPEALADSAAQRFIPIIEHLQVGSVLSVPMVYQRKVVGVTTLLRSGTENPYTEADLALVRTLADHAALALANGRSRAAERAARRALELSDAAHRLVFEASPVPLLVFDTEDYAILAVNEALAELYGFNFEELLGMTLVDLRADRDKDFVRSTIARGPGELRGNAVHRRKDGSELYVEYRARPLTLGGRRARIVVITDLNRQRDAEEMRALFEAVVHSSNDAIVTKRLDGTITSWNAAAERLFGYSAAETIDRNVSLLVPASRLYEERALLAEIAAGHRVEHFETTRRRKDGVEVPVSISLAQILDASGRIVGASKTARDLTAQRNTDAALRETAEMLRQSQKMEAVGRLAGGIAHDFNNMLSVILSYTDLILRELPEGDPLAADVEEVHAAGVRAADLTRQLLMFSRQQVVECKVLDVGALLGGLDKMVRRIVGDDVEVVVARAANLDRILADPSSVEQVVMNLVVNARDAMPTGGTITIATENVVLESNDGSDRLGGNPGPHVMLSVTDTGVGISADVKARIFEPFFTTKEPGKGTGLGLSTVFGIAQQAGGCIGVESTVGAGTTFRVYFPRVDADASDMRPTFAPSTGRGSETILLVEDEPRVRAVACAILKRSGYRMIVAADAPDAIAISASFPGTIDILLTDVVMPQMGGAVLARRVRRFRPAMKVLCMSGYTDDSVVRHGVLESEVAFLQKPFTPESLMRKVREVLDAPITAPLRAATLPAAG